jgi:hypothetical protein
VPKPSESNTGAIVGAVIGGIICFTVIAISIWWLSKRKRSTVRQSEGSSPEKIGMQEARSTDREEIFQVDDQHGYSEMNTSEEPKQLADQHGVSELAG